METYHRAYTCVFSRCHHLQFLSLLFGVIFRIWVKVSKHSIDAFVYHLLWYDAVNVKQIQFLYNVIVYRQQSCQMEAMLVIGICNNRKAYG